MKIVAIDPSMAHTCLVVATVENGQVRIDDSITINTSKTKTKQVRASSDTVERCHALYSNTKAYLDVHDPDITMCETPSGSQNASGMKSYGISCFLIATVSPRPIEVTPTEVKMASVMNKKASKKDMIEWAFRKHPEAPWKIGKDGMPQITTDEHLADAIAVIYAGLRTAEFSRISSFVK